MAQLCCRLRAQADASLTAAYTAVLDRLSAPLQVAVVGRVSSGKSTLVNALIGRRVAHTAEGERTHLVTRYRHGTVDHLEVVTHEGVRRALPFAADGTPPVDVAACAGIAPEAVSHVEVYLTSDLLRDLTVIDTPGLGSPDPLHQSRAEAVLDQAGSEALDDVSQRAVLGAEAVIYVLTQTVRKDDHDVLGAFASATARRHPGPANAIAVLNMIDTVPPESIDDATDHWSAARLLAERYADTLGARVAAVIPMIGLLAETAESGAFTSADADALRLLAELPDNDQEIMLLAGDVFTDWDCPVSVPARTRLLRLLDRYGIATALSALRAAADTPTGELRRLLLAESGLHALRGALDTVFRLRADGIKAAAALASLAAIAERVLDRPVERERIKDGIEELLARPNAHGFRVLEALTAVSSGAVHLPEDLTTELFRICGGGTPAERLGLADEPHAVQVAHALERAGWWRSFSAFGATPAQSRLAHVVHRAYFLLWRELNEGSPG